MAKTAIVKTETETTALAVPEDLRATAGLGTETLGSEDVRPPRLSLAQAMSPQVKKGDAKRIEGLEEGHLFNDLSGEAYGEGPLEFVVVKSLGARGIEFAPMEEGGGIIDRDVPLSDPRMQFVDGPPDKSGRSTRIKPKATKFYDYLVWLPQQQELMAFSMKGTQLKVAVTLNSLLKSPLKVDGHLIMKPPAWARTFRLSTAMEKNEKYSWANFKVSQGGVTPIETRQLALELYKAYDKKTIVIEREVEATEGREPGQDDEM